MHRYRFADAYIHNVFAVASPHSLVMVDRDQFGFPLMYAQDVDRERPDVVVLDQELLRRSWYLQDLEHQHPGLIAGSRAQVEAFLAAVKPFEAGQAYDGTAIDDAYYAMIKSFVDQYEKAGRDVYFAYQPDQRIVQGYSGESVVALLKARRGRPGQEPGGRGRVADAARSLAVRLRPPDRRHRAARPQRPHGPRLVRPIAGRSRPAARPGRPDALRRRSSLRSASSSSPAAARRRSGRPLPRQDSPNGFR